MVFDLLDSLKLLLVIVANPYDLREHLKQLYELILIGSPIKLVPWYLPLLLLCCLSLFLRGHCLLSTIDSNLHFLLLFSLLKPAECLKSLNDDVEEGFLEEAMRLRGAHHALVGHELVQDQLAAVCYRELQL